MRDAERGAAEFVTAATSSARLLAEVESQLLEASRALTAIDDQLERRKLEKERGRLASILEKAIDEDERLREARATLVAIKIDLPAMKRLRSLDEKRSEAEGALRGSSTAIRFELLTPDRVTVDGSPAPIKDQLSVSNSTQLDIAEIGRITILPGGEELATKRANVGNATSQLIDALNKVGCGTVAEAESRLGERQHLEASIAGHTTALNIHAPNGVEHLRDEAAALAAKLEALPNTALEIPLDRATAVAVHEDASKRAKSVKTESATREAILNARKLELARETGLSQAADQKAADSALELERARELKADGALREELATKLNAVTAAKVLLESAQSKLESADPEAAQLSFESARDGLAAIDAEIARLTTESNLLAIELRALGQQGFGEVLDELKGRLEVARTVRIRVEKDAASLKLLFETLKAAEQNAREAFLAPVQRRVQPYLRFLLPDTELVLSETNLDVTALRRNGVDEPFDLLSVGAREQVAVLTRLAFADLLREQGVIAPVVLDDALVNTDPRRFERMLMALRRAAKNLQIVVLTCDEADWIQAGIPVIRLSDCIGRRDVQ